MGEAERFYREKYNEFDGELYKESMALEMILSKWLSYCDRNSCSSYSSFKNYEELFSEMFRYTGVYSYQVEGSISSEISPYRKNARWNRVAARLSDGSEFYLVQPSGMFIYELLYLGSKGIGNKEKEALANFLNFFNDLSVWYNQSYRDKVFLPKVKSLLYKYDGKYSEYFKGNMNWLYENNKQFIDSSYGLSQDEYNKWIKDSKKRFLQGIYACSLLYGDNYAQYLCDGYGKYTKMQLATPLIGNLNAKQIATILDSMDLYMIMNLISDKGRIEASYIYNSDLEKDIKCQFYGKDNEYFHFERSDSTTMLSGVYNDGLIYSYPFQVNTRGDSDFDKKPFHVKQIYGHNLGGDSANELLFRFLRLPVSVVLGSINEVNTGYSSGLPFEDSLCSRIEEISKKEPDKYKALRLVKK